MSTLGEIEALRVLLGLCACGCGAAVSSPTKTYTGTNCRSRAYRKRQRLKKLIAEQPTQLLQAADDVGFLLETADFLMAEARKIAQLAQQRQAGAVVVQQLRGGQLSWLEQSSAPPANGRRPGREDQGV